AIFGGRFDPIHNGHLAVAREVLKTNNADEVWLSVENQHQWRPIVASSDDRKHMAALAIQEVNKEYASSEARSSHIRSNNKLKIDMTPAEIGGLTDTITVMRTLRKKYPEHQFVFIVG